MRRPTQNFAAAARLMEVCESDLLKTLIVYNPVRLKISCQYANFSS